MSGSASTVAFLILAVFLGGVTLGAVALASIGSRLEDRRYSLMGAAPGATTRGARRLNGLSGTGTHFQSRRRGR
jgi:hypothetical protein